MVFLTSPRANLSSTVELHTNFLGLAPTTLITFCQQKTITHRQSSCFYLSRVFYWQSILQENGWTPATRGPSAYRPPTNLVEWASHGAHTLNLRPAPTKDILWLLIGNRRLFMALHHDKTTLPRQSGSDKLSLLHQIERDLPHHFLCYCCLILHKFDEPEEFRLKGMRVMSRCRLPCAVDYL